MKTLDDVVDSGELEGSIPWRLHYGRLKVPGAAKGYGQVWPAQVHLNAELS